MITKDSLKALLLQLGFTNNGNHYCKTFTDTATYLGVDFDKALLVYPEDQGLTINERQTCNFSANENFVVFECVHRLLEKGYKPEHIELEPKWKLGHGASGGRADILIKDNQDQPLLIIECKTPGMEFDKAWQKTLQDGGQLFSYAQQISQTRFLCLYAADFANDSVSRQSTIIQHIDDEKILAENPKLKGFRDAADVKARFAVWRDTYKLAYRSSGLFEDGEENLIGKPSYSLANLRPLNQDPRKDKKYHDFATILRQHNVSGRENAFDKLVNLFLCKLVDEQQHPDDLKFYWKGIAFDTPIELLDRLQQLYQAGMKQFLNEEITYISRDEVINALRFIKKDPDATQQAVWALFVEQKFFTNSDFSFIDVHNKRLFYQNAEVLIKILQLWQDIRLTDDHGHQQFLGDMFEGFLDQGIKQSEGQFFTPMPICRFMVMSLPLARFAAAGTPPKAIDYACGAGHFLTELALQLKSLLTEKADLAAYHKAIVGIEKEYRLSKIAKVSAFMYGQRDIAICYGDALVKNHPAFPAIADDSFDILVANPPYSVRGFLQTLPEDERAAYRLSDAIDKLDSNNSIETFFVERAQQLLKAGGVAAIILPSSILSNGGAAYIRAREIVLQTFDLVAIVELGSGTFGKTGTNTVILFLRRKDTKPDTARHYLGRVNAWFDDDGNQAIYHDAELYQRYAGHLGINADDYRTVFSGQFSKGLLAHETFADYRRAFDNSTEINGLKKQKTFQNKTGAEQQAELDKRFTAFVQAIEKDKLFYFVLAYTNPQNVLVVKSPSGTKEQKAFLGYEWSSAKGNEGIKLVTDKDGNHVTPLYHPKDRNHPNKINSLIAQNFLGQPLNLSGLEDLKGFVSSVRLVDLLDFSRVGFDKQIGLATTKNAVEIQSKWELVKLGKVCSFEYGKPLPEDKRIDGEYPVMGSNGKVGFHNEFLVKGPCIIIGRKGSAGEVILENKDCFPIDTTFYVAIKNEKLILDYLFLVLKKLKLDTLRSGIGVPGLNRNDAYQLDIPFPPLEIQQKIVTECEAIDNAVTTAQASIAAAQHGIESLVLSSAFEMQKLGAVATKVSDTVDPQSQEGDVFYIGLENIESHTGRLIGNTQTPYQAIKSTKICYQPGDVLYGKLRPNLNKVYLAQETGICSTDILVFRFTNPVQAKFYARYFLTETFNAEVLKGVSGQQLPRTSWTNMQDIKIPTPNSADQQTLVAEIEKLEQTIAAAQTTLTEAAAKKQAVLDKYL